MYIIKHNFPECCLKDLFSFVNDKYNLRSQSDFRIPGINTLFKEKIQLGILDQYYGVVFQLI